MVPPVAAVPPPLPSVTNRSSICRPTSMCCHSGTGRCSETITLVRVPTSPPRTVDNQSPNSSALLTVADNEMTCTEGGRWMMTSSHTAPRHRSAR